MSTLSFPGFPPVKAAGPDVVAYEIVFCEKHGPRPHVMQADCVWPHLVGPSGPQPSVGHPLTPHD